VDGGIYRRMRCWTRDNISFRTDPGRRAWRTEMHMEEEEEEEQVRKRSRASFFSRGRATICVPPLSLSLSLSFLSTESRNRMPKQIDVFAALASDVNNSVASRKLGGLAEINYCFSCILLASVHFVLTTFRFSCKILRA